MQYVYILMCIRLDESGWEQIVPVTGDSDIPQVFATRDECVDLEEDEFLMAVPVHGPDYPLKYK